MNDKNCRILHIVNHLQTKYGLSNILIKDHWECDRNAIGLTDKTGNHLAYISTSDKDNDYYLALENPPIDIDVPYLPAGDFDKLSLIELETILTKHLRLTI